MSFRRDDRWVCQFPISLAIEGPSCYQRMADAGLGRLLFCSVIYSPYRLIMPRYPQRGIYSLEEGRYYFPAEARRYRELPVIPQPSVDFADRDLLGEAVAGARKASLQPGVWVTLFANGMIAKNHPRWAVQNLYGSADRLFLCFNNPEVREYSLRVCAEIAERYDVSEIMLDKIPQTCLELNSFAGRIDPVLRTVGSFCFCPHCVANAATHGVDLEACRRDALQLAARSLAIPPHVVNAQADELKGDTEIPLLLLDNPWILQVLNLRIESIRSFLRETRRRIEGVRRNVALSMAFVPPVKVGHDAASPRSWLAAQSYAAYRESAADMIHCVIHWDRDVVEYDTRRAVDSVRGGNVRICTHVRAYGPARPEEMAGLASAAGRGGASGVAFFCYDLMTDDMLKAIAQIG